MGSISIGRHSIGPGHKPFIIAELSGNHNGSVQRGIEIIKAAAAAGAHAIKLQTYTADSITLNCDDDRFKILDKGSPWYGRRLYELYQEAATPYEWHKHLFDCAHELGMECFSTPFDEEAVDFLEGLGSVCYKVASFESTDHRLLKRIAKTGKPVIMSTGVSTLAEIYESVAVLRNNGCKDLVLLKCTSNYPADAKDANLRTIPFLRDAFDTEVGLSDHTLGIGVAIASVALGATVIEKHFTLSRADGGVDSSFSMEPNEMAQLVVESEKAWNSLGIVQKEPSAAEIKSKTFRRSLVASSPIAEGEFFTENNVRIVRPSHGLPPKFFDEVIGKRATKSLKVGDGITWDAI